MALTSFIVRLVAIIACALVGFFLIGVGAFRYPAPYLDDFVFVEFILRAGPDWRDYLAQYMEFRPVTFRILSVLHYRLTGGEGAFFPILSVGAQIAAAWLVVRCVLSFDAPVQLKTILAAVTVSAMFRFYTLELYVWFSGVHHVLTSTLAILALWLATVGVPSFGRAAAATVIGLLAALGHGNGFVVWFVLAAMAWLGRDRSAWLPLAAGSAWVVVYLSTYELGRSTSDPIAALHRPDQLILYVLHWFGAPYAHNKIIWPVGLVISAAIIAVFIWLTIHLVRARAAGERRNPSIFAFGLMAFSFCSAFLAALVRIEFGVLQAAVPRYGTFLAMAVAGAIVALVPLLREWWQTRSRAVSTAALLIMIALAVETAVSFGYYRDRSANVREHIQAVRAGDWSDARLIAIYPFPEYARSILVRLKETGTYLYKD